MAERSKIYPSSEELVKLGFERKGSGEDPRDFWQEIDLTNKEASENEISLQLDAYFDFSLYMPELTEPIPLNFKSIQEIETFISIFKRPWNGAFSEMLDICSSQTECNNGESYTSVAEPKQCRVHEVRHGNCR